MSNPLRLLNFVPEAGEEIVSRQPVIPDRPLFEILKENKDKKDAEFNDRFKHRPPKALDEDETEFLELVRTHKQEQERLIATEEARELEEFHAAIASRAAISEEQKVTTVKHENERPALNKVQSRPKTHAAFIRIVPQAKKAKLDVGSKDMQSALVGPATEDVKTDEKPGSTVLGLVSYSDESDDED